MTYSRTRCRLGSAVLAILAVLVSASAIHGQDMSSAKLEALEMAKQLDTEITGMANTLWDFSEIALQESRSASYLADLLEREGFTVERGVAGMPTAFVASFGSGSPIVGILAEYDALPGIGNAARPERVARDDGHRHGHGCGHNLFGAGSVAAAIAVKRTMAAEGVAGTIRLYGTPAEETVVGKAYMARDGFFDDLDAALEWHPWLETGVNNQSGLAMNSFTVEFHGQAAHAAADPWNGRSALDAVELMNDAVNLMREHVKPTTRIHYVIPSGGEAPNVVPEYAKVWYYIRDLDRESVEVWYDWLMDIAQAAALATRTTHEVTLITGVHALLLNRPLQEAVQRNLEYVGAPDFDERDQLFARSLQRYLEIDEKGLMDSVLPLSDDPLNANAGSTDVAEVSRIVPTVGLWVTSAAAGVPWHSWATAASHGTPGAVKSARVAARVLAMTGIELLTDPALRAQARVYWTDQMAGRPYVSPLPEGQAPPLPAGGGGGARD